MTVSPEVLYFMPRANLQMHTYIYIEKKSHRQVNKEFMPACWLRSHDQPYRNVRAEGSPTSRS